MGDKGPKILTVVITKARRKADLLIQCFPIVSFESIRINRRIVGQRYVSRKEMSNKLGNQHCKLTLEWQLLA